MRETAGSLVRTSACYRVQNPYEIRTVGSGALQKLKRTPNRMRRHRALVTHPRRQHHSYGDDVDLLLLVLLIASWGASWPIAQFALESWGQRPLLFTAIRTLLSGILFLGLSLSSFKRVCNSRLLIVASIASLFNVVGSMTGMIYAVHFLNSAGLASLLYYVQPLFVALLAMPVLRDPLTWQMHLAIVIGFAGVALIAIHGIHHARPVEGVLCGLGGALSWAIGTIYLRKQTSREVSDAKYVHKVATAIAGPEFLIGGFAILTLSIAFEHGPIPPWTSGSIGGLIAFTLAGATGWFLYFLLINRGVTVARVSSWSFGVPFIAYVLGYITLHETIDGWVAIGGCAIIGSIFSIERMRLVTTRTSQDHRSAVPAVQSEIWQTDDRSSYDL